MGFWKVVVLFLSASGHGERASGNKHDQYDNKSID